MGAPAADVLVSVPHAQLHQVAGNVQQLLQQGTFTVAVISPELGAPPESSKVEAGVGPYTWELGKHLPALKAAGGIYSFALAHTKSEYLIVVLPPDTPGDVLEAVHDVLHHVCAFSTVKQVDAAAEEVDKLQGGKQAAALKTAEAAGAGPSAAAGAATAAAAQTAGPHPAPPSAAPGAPGQHAPAAAGAAPAPPLGHIQSGKYTLPTSGNKTADKVAAGLLTAGAAVASAVGAAATATAGAIQNYAQKQMTAPASLEHAKVSPHFKRGLAVAGVIASSAAYVTAKLAEAVGHASYVTALAIAKSLPGHKKRHAQAAGAAASDEVTPEERSVLHTVGAAGLVAFVDVYDSLESAAKVVFYQSADATSQYIQYKYGPEAGQAAQESVPVAKDMLDATINFSRLGARAFISKTAKTTSKVYFKSTLAGLHPDEQAAGRRLPVTTAAPAAPGQAGPSAAPAAGVQAGAVHAAHSGGPSPYPPGSSAAAAAGAGAAQPYPAK